MKYGDKITITEGVFENCNGIFFEEKESISFYKRNNTFYREKKNQCLVEVFIKTKAQEYTPTKNSDYFRDYLFNDKIPEKTTSVLIKISKKYIKTI